jgi:hypothetical protein
MQTLAEKKGGKAKPQTGPYKNVHNLLMPIMRLSGIEPNTLRHGVCIFHRQRVNKEVFYG